MVHRILDDGVERDREPFRVVERVDVLDRAEHPVPGDRVPSADRVDDEGSVFQFTP